jgi:large subunit ribosomal protein L5
MSADQAKPAKGAAKADAKPAAKPAKAAPQTGAKKSGEKGGKGAVGIQAGARPKVAKDYVPRFKKLYDEKVVPALTKRFQYKNPMQVPRLEKVVINVGVGEAVANPRLIDGVVKEIALISGQRPCISKARKSISNFKLREGMPIGAFVTLRRAQMWEFIDRLITVATPRIRDFRGLPDRGFDGRGNYTVGLKEQIIFPEIDLDSVEKIRGMDMTFVTTARTDVEAYELLKELGLPLRKKEEKRAPVADAA